MWFRDKLLFDKTSLTGGLISLRKVKLNDSLLVVKVLTTSKEPFKKRINSKDLLKSYSSH
ncbi:Uncharacterized protein PRO82_000241 [Candidatus Protochlamydia amoebophila]|nr:Uncharacterized protein [Candidatus Protochlamydia amoebophila]